LQNSPTSDCNTVIAGQMDVDVANAHDFENDKGCLTLSHANNSNPGLALIADSSSQTILGLDDMPNVPLYFESNIAYGNTLGEATNVFATGNFAAWCNPQYAAGNSGCVRQAVRAGGEFSLANPTPSTVWAYNPSANLVFQPHADQLTASILVSATDLKANINVVTAIGSGTGAKGVMLPFSTKASDLVSNVGAAGCIQIVNFNVQRDHRLGPSWRNHYERLDSGERQYRCFPRRMENGHVLSGGRRGLGGQLMTRDHRPLNQAAKRFERVP
jgi:hypothetical protein